MLCQVQTNGFSCIIKHIQSGDPTTGFRPTSTDFIVFHKWPNSKLVALSPHKHLKYIVKVSFPASITLAVQASKCDNNIIFCFPILFCGLFFYTSFTIYVYISSLVCIFFFHMKENDRPLQFCMSCH